MKGRNALILCKIEAIRAMQSYVDSCFGEDVPDVTNVEIQELAECALRGGTR